MHFRLGVIITLNWFISYVSTAQNDNVGSGHAIQFDGVDDVFIIGDHYHGLDFPISIQAWVYYDPSYALGIPVFATNDNQPIYHGFWLFVSPNSILCEYGDGKGGNNSAFRQGKVVNLTFPKGKWVQVTAVMTNKNDIKIFLNGINMGGSSSGGSSGDMAFSNPGEVAKIGHFVSNSVTYRYKGMIDEVRLWNRALSENDIRESMCKKLAGTENGLIGYWTFDETSGGTVFDKSPNHFDGMLEGNVQRVYSGAPIGDKSVFSYPSNWTGNSLTLNDGNNGVTISGITTSTAGMHIYEVENIPSQINGLDMTQIISPYFGIYAATVNTTTSFNVSYKINNSLSCKIFSRMDNSQISWNELLSSNVQDRAELISLLPPPIFTFDLGGDKILCDQSSQQLNSNIDPSGKSFHWSTGETTPSIVVTNSGTFSLDIIEGCAKVSDTITITFQKSPSQGDLLGADEVICTIEPKELKPQMDLAGFTITWQDGSHNNSFTVTDYGKFWLQLENHCGVATDTIEFSRPVIDYEKIPNVITPNDDSYNQYFIVDSPFIGSQFAVFNRWGKEVYRDERYQNNWDGSGVDSGIYFYSIQDECLNQYKGILSIVR